MCLPINREDAEESTMLDEQQDEWVMSYINAIMQDQVNSQQGAPSYIVVKVNETSADVHTIEITNEVIRSTATLEAGGMRQMLQLAITWKLEDPRTNTSILIITLDSDIILHSISSNDTHVVSHDVTTYLSPTYIV